MDCHLITLSSSYNCGLSFHERAATRHQRPSKNSAMTSQIIAPVKQTKVQLSPR
ncbi:hypothetical protein TorRG33x02_167550 [Trema orientale]|uniref:Uncharacterized protein n=1 Tax=Trema orientale TaxID=63057 RepID=A0A2P5EPH3_TREOI|nr:hypothetical protein TorRG33x02_167550 [Trema orientale]